MPAKDLVIQVDPIRDQTLRVSILGTRPLILNRMSEKARQQLLLPSGRKNAAEKASSLKHNPLEEFRAAPYTLGDDGASTYLALLGSMFHKGMAAAALDLPGAAKAQITRLAWIEEDRVPVYGIPELFMSVTRSADMNRTPDVRTRVIVPRWACQIHVSYVAPNLNEKSVINLLSTAGVVSGVGDWRRQKGGNYGQYRLVGEEDEAFTNLLASAGRKPQLEAMKSPAFYDEETEELYKWFEQEAEHRGKLAVAK